MHLLQSNVDLNMIRFWLGHASIATTNGYVEIDLEMKRKTLRSSERLIPAKAKRDAQGAMTTSFSRGWQSCDYVKHDKRNRARQSQSTRPLELNLGRVRHINRRFT